MQMFVEQCRKLAALFLFVLLTAVSIIVLLQRQQESLLLSVQSGSMQPSLRKGDAVVLGKADAVSISVGDIVSYADPERAGMVISHRVLKIDRYTGQMTTKGDNNSFADPPTSIVNIAGRVSYVIPKAGWLIDSLHRWQGLVAMVYLPVAVILAQEMAELARQYRRPTYMAVGYRA